MPVFMISWGFYVPPGEGGGMHPTYCVICKMLPAYFQTFCVNCFTYSTQSITLCVLLFSMTVVII